MLSQNGWSASADRVAIGVVPFAVAGVFFPGGVKSGVVTDVLRYVVEQFHERVEPLRAGECWGHAYREITGSSEVTNHGSGTAVDTNAPLHPLGRKGTFSKVQVSAIHDILTEVEHVVRWGGDYEGRVDEMHWEINANESEVRRVARKLWTPPTPYVRTREVLYIKCEMWDTTNNQIRTSTALLSGPFFIGLSGVEVANADTNIAKGALLQWVNPETWNELDRRSKFVTVNP